MAMLVEWITFCQFNRLAISQRRDHVLLSVMLNTITLNHGIKQPFVRKGETLC